MTTLEVERRAQTNIQLYLQLLAAGYGGQEVAGVREAYMLATKLFAGQLRPEGRPFVCHLVGVASILAMVEATHATVIAGLLHSAYSHGDFGYGNGQMTGKMRDQVRAVVGPQVESVVAGYSSSPWNAASVASCIANAERLVADKRQIVVIRLADTVEDALDLGLQLSEKQENPNRDISAESLIALANVLGYPALGTALRRVIESPKDGMELSGLRERHAGSYLICPASWREKMLPRLVRLVRRVRWAGSGDNARR
jgi:(p)ppGpp synthase/HD superfamily hydrolase